MNGRHYVGYVGTLGDQTRFAINHGVVDFALFLVLLAGRFNQLTAELTFEFIDIFLLHVFLSFRATLPWRLATQAPADHGRAS
jgi:hypothetical protein